MDHRTKAKYAEYEATEGELEWERENCKFKSSSTEEGDRQGGGGEGYEENGISSDLEDSPFLLLEDFASCHLEASVLPRSLSCCVLSQYVFSFQ